MLNIVDEVKAFLALRNGLSKLQQPGSLDLLDPSHLGALLAIAGTVYAGVKQILPPQTSLEVGVGLALLFLLYSFMLKLHGQAVTPIPGIPALDPSQIQTLLAAIEAKYPQLANVEKAVKETVAAAQVIQAAPPAPPKVDAPAATS